MVKNVLAGALLVVVVIGSSAEALRMGVAGLSHGHAGQLLKHWDSEVIQVVGIAESNADVVRQYVDKFKFPPDLVFESLEEMVEQVKPEAVAALNPLNEHLDVVRICAPRGIHVIVEKPLAATLEQAREMERLARKYGILLLTNYETTWYASNHEAHGMVVQDKKIGQLRKIVVHSGHAGPKMLGVKPEFLEWLVDPVKNGGGAVVDFGCYGASQITWFMKGKRPDSVIAVLQTNRPDLYEVDDEATIILQYPGAQGIIQASWCWPYGRKDMKLYGSAGSLEVESHNQLSLRLGDGKKEEDVSLGKVPNPKNVAFIRLAEIISKGEPLAPTDPSSLEANMIVMEILDAAIRSAETGTRILLSEERN
jgi:predicted dehydrogenase